MYIEIELEGGKVIEFWGVRAWNYSVSKENLVWIYFQNTEISGQLPNGGECGCVENARVLQSFVVPDFIGTCQEEFLLYIK